MTKEEAMELSEELGELSENEEKNMDRMKEIAKVLTDFYLDNNKGNANIKQTSVCGTDTRRTY